MNRKQRRAERRCHAKNLLRDQQGATMIYAAITIGLMVGMAGFAVDFGRLFTTNTEGQAAADAAAIAAASQLDGRDLTRATEAAQNAIFVQNQQTFANGDANIAISGIRFLSGLPASDDTPIDASYETTDPADARFVEVTVQLTQDNLFLPVLGADAQAPTEATAVAGLTETVCKMPPLFICNPFETASNKDFPIESVRGHSVLAKTKGGGSAAWAPGDFGLLDPSNMNFDTSTQSGAKAVAQALAQTPSDGCFGGRVDLKPGVTNSFRTGLNVRFDMYENPFFGSAAVRADPKYRPALNVTKGKDTSGGSCNAVDDPAAMELPRDNCLTTGTCSTALPGRIGDGVWDRAAYWAANHAASDPQPANFATISRYEMYRYEIDNGLIPNGGGASPENGNPQCYNSGPSGESPSDDPDRRVLILAVVNCIEQGPLSGASVTQIPVESYVEAFITEPVSSGAETDVLLEFVDEVDRNSGVLHDLVQLYR